MLRKILIAGLAVFTVAAVLASTDADARWRGGYYRGGWHGGYYRGWGGPRYYGGYYPAYGYGAYGCYRSVRVWGPYGPYWRRVWVCG